MDRETRFTNKHSVPTVCGIIPAIRVTGQNHRLTVGLLLVRSCGRFCQRRCVASVPADALRAHSRSSTDESLRFMPTSLAISILSH